MRNHVVILLLAMGVSDGASVGRGEGIGQERCFVVLLQASALGLGQAGMALRLYLFAVWSNLRVHLIGILDNNSHLEKGKLELK